MKKQLRRDKQAQIEKILKTTKQVKEVQKLAGSIESLNKIISETLYIQKGIAVDTKNFTLMSVPDAKELFNHKQRT